MSGVVRVSGMNLTAVGYAGSQRALALPVGRDRGVSRVPRAGSGSPDTGHL